MKKRFIFDENFNKEKAKKNMPKMLIVGALVLFLIIIIIVIALATRNNSHSGSKKPSKVTPVFEFKDELVVESGSKIPEVEDYFSKLENIDLKEIEIIYPDEFEISYDTTTCSEEDIEKLNNNEVSFKDLNCAIPYLKHPAVYGVTVKLQEKEQTVMLVVQDTTAPTLMTKNLEIFESEDYKVEDFVSACYDVAGGCKVNFENEEYSKYKDPGDYKVNLVAEDEFGNKTNPYSVNLTIKKVDRKLYTITFNSDGGTKIDAISVEEGNSVVSPTNPTREGYTFKGWYNGNNPYDFSNPVVSNITLKAKWEKNSGTTTQNQVQISLDFKTINLTVGQAKTVKATVKNADAKNIVWSSGDKRIATVDNGKITGVKEGKTYITATIGGKSAKVEVIVRNSAGTTCKYGDTNYNTKYVMSVKLATGNCALDPNSTPNENVSTKDYQKLIDDISGLGIKYSAGNFSYKADYYKIKNNAGTGLVGYRITITVSVIDNDNPYIVLTSKYVIKPDGTRDFISNKICKNNMCLE